MPGTLWTKMPEYTRSFDTVTIFVGICPELSSCLVTGSCIAPLKPHYQCWGFCQPVINPGPIHSPMSPRESWFWVSGPMVLGPYKKGGEMKHLLMSEFPSQPMLKSQSYIVDRSVFPEDQWNWYIHLHLVDFDDKCRSIYHSSFNFASACSTARWFCCV